MVKRVSEIDLPQILKVLLFSYVASLNRNLKPSKALGERRPSLWAQSLSTRFVAA